MASSSFGTLFRHKASGKQIVCKPISIEVKSNWTFQNAAFGWTTESICSATVLSRTTCGHRLLLVGVDLKGPWHWYCCFLHPPWLHPFGHASCQFLPGHNLVCVCFLRYVEPGGTCNIQVQVKPSRLEIPLEPLCQMGTVLTDWAGWMGFSAMHQQSLYGRHAHRQETAAICHFFSGSHPGTWHTCR
jgi:hypothetical protein